MIPTENTPMGSSLNAVDLDKMEFRYTEREIRNGTEFETNEYVLIETDDRQLIKDLFPLERNQL